MFSLLGKRTASTDLPQDGQQKRDMAQIAWPNTAQEIMCLLNQAKAYPEDPFIQRYGSRRSNIKKGVTSEMDDGSDIISDSDRSSTDGRKTRAHARKASQRDDEEDNSAQRRERR